MRKHNIGRISLIILLLNAIFIAIFATICAVVGACFIVRYGYRGILQGIFTGMRRRTVPSLRRC